MSEMLILPKKLINCDLDMAKTLAAVLKYSTEYDSKVCNSEGST